MLSCINFEKLPAARATAEQLSKEFEGLLSPYQIGQLWNIWLNQDVKNRKSEAPTKDDILTIYGELAATTKKELFENQTITNKENVIDALQYMFFYGIRTLSGTDNLTSEVINKYKDEAFSKIVQGLKRQGYNIIVDNFDSYKEYFVKQRLSKLGVEEIDEEFEEKAVKDNVSSTSSVFIENKKNASDEVVWLLASLNSDKKIFNNLLAPVDFEETWNILQNILGNSLNFEDQVTTLKAYANKYPWIPQLLDRLGVTDEAKYSPDLNKIVTSFTEAFAKQKSDIIVASAGPKDSYSSIDSKTKITIREKFKGNFFTSKFVERINGELQLNKAAYNALKLQNTDADLIKFLEVFGFEGVVELTPEDRQNITWIKKKVDNSNEKIIWIDDQHLDVKNRVEKIIKSYVPLEQENKTLSAPNAEGKQQYAVHNHNYFSRFTSKLKRGMISAKNYFEELFGENKADTVIISGIQTSTAGDGNEKAVFSDLGLSDIFNTLLSNMFSNNPVIHLPRTADKSMERGFQIFTKNQDDILAFTKISPKLINNLYNLFTQDKLDKLHPDWDYGVPNDEYLAFWESLGINKNDNLSKFTQAINKYIQDQRTDTKELLKELKLFYKEQGKWKGSFTDNVLNKFNFETLSLSKQEEVIDQITDNFNFNMFYFAVGHTKSMYGTLVPVKAENMFKRFAASVAEGRQISLSPNLAAEISADYKKWGFNYDPNIIKVLVHKSTVNGSKDKKILKYSDKYKKNDTDDAQGLATLPLYRTLLKGANQWTDIQEKAYQEVMQGKPFNESVFPPIKPVGYFLIEIDGYKVPVYIKTSIYPMSPADIQGTNNELKYEYAKQNDIGLYIPKSAIKMATPKNLKDVISYDTVNDNPTFNFPLEDFRIQLDITAKDSTKQLQGTQERKLLYTNLFEGGKPLDPKYKKWLDDNIDTLEKLADIERKNLYEAAGISEVDKDGVIEYKISNYSALKQMVKDELINREYPINTVESLNSIIDTDGNLLGTIDGLPSRQKVMNLLNAIVTNRLIRLYTNGSSLVQVSQQGWELKADANVDTPTSIDFVSKEAKENYIKNEGLAFFDLGDKTGAAEVILPAKFKKFVKKDEQGNYIIDDEQVLINIGYRIPTQGHNSILHLRVVGFLPAHLNQMVIVPKEITTQGGSDFDVDKLNLFIPNVEVVNGKVQMINDQMNPEEIFQTKKESYSKIINFLNRKIEKYYKNLAKDENYISSEAIEKIIDDPQIADLEKLEINLILEQYKVDETKYENLYKKLTNFQDKEFRQKWINNFKKKQLQNKLITQAVQILEDPIVRSQLVTPNSADGLKKSSQDRAKMMKDADIETKQLELNWSNIFTGINLGKVIYEMFASKALVGVFASQSTHHTLAQQVGLHFNNMPRPFFFDHNKTKDGKPDLSKIKGRTGLIISDRLGNEYLTASVDAAKENYLIELGVTLQTGDMTALFERLGGDPEYFYAWINLPPIQRYLELKAINDSITVKEIDQKVSDTEIIDQVLKEFRLPSIAYKNKKEEDTNSINEARTLRGEYTTENILDYWPRRGVPNVQMLADLFDDFLYFKDAASVLRRSVATTKFDTAGPGKNLAESNLLKFKYDNFVNEMITTEGYSLATMEDGVTAPYEDLVFKTQLKVFYKSSFNFVKAIYQDLTVLQKNANIEQVFRLFVDPSKKWVSKFGDSQDADIVYGAIVNYMIQNQLGEKPKLFFGDNTLGHRIVKIQNDPTHPLHDNPIIQEFFTIELKPDSKTPTIISPIKKSLSADESSFYTSKFEEIKTIDKSLYEDFIRVAMFQTGVVASPVSYYNQLPYYDVIPMVNKALSEGIDNFKVSNSIDRTMENVGGKLKTLGYTNLRIVKSNGSLLTTNNTSKTILTRTQAGPARKIGDNLFYRYTPKNFGSIYYNFTSKAEDMEEEKDFEFEVEDETIIPTTSTQPQAPVTAEITEKEIKDIINYSNLEKEDYEIALVNGIETLVILVNMPKTIKKGYTVFYSDYLKGKGLFKRAGKKLVVPGFEDIQVMLDQEDKSVIELSTGLAIPTQETVQSKIIEELEYIFKTKNIRSVIKESKKINANQPGTMISKLEEPTTLIEVKEESLIESKLKNIYNSLSKEDKNKIGTFEQVYEMYQNLPFDLEMDEFIDQLKCNS